MKSVCSTRDVLDPVKSGRKDGERSFSFSTSDQGIGGRIKEKSVPSTRSRKLNTEMSKDVSRELIEGVTQAKENMLKKQEEGMEGEKGREMQWKFSDYLFNYPN